MLNNPEGSKRSPSTINIGHWNAWSMKEKTSSICDLILEAKLDLLVITESWLHDDATADLVTADLSKSLLDFHFCHLPRPSRGGGIYNHIPSRVRAE